MCVRAHTQTHTFAPVFHLILWVVLGKYFQGEGQRGSEFMELAQVRMTNSWWIPQATNPDTSGSTVLPFSLYKSLLILKACSGNVWIFANRKKNEHVVSKRGPQDSKSNLLTLNGPVMENIGHSAWWMPASLHVMFMVAVVWVFAVEQQKPLKNTFILLTFDEVSHSSKHFDVNMHKCHISICR